MKKLSKLLALTAGFATLFFAGCSDVDSGYASEGVKNQTNLEKEYSVSFAAADGTAIDLSTLVATENTSDRSIVATNQDLSTYKYFLWGTNLVANSTVKPKEVKFTADATDKTKGTVTLALDVANYKLVLAAVSAADASSIDEDTSSTDIKKVALYVGYANVDLRNTNSIKFYITTDGLTGDAEFALTIVYDGETPAGTWSSAHKTLVGDTAKYKIAGYIANRTDGSSKYPSTKPTNNIANTAFFGAGDTTLTGSTTPGTYNLVIEFTDGATEKVYQWSDTIILLPKQKVTATVKVPDVIEYAPDAPEDLQVGYVQPSTDDIGTYTAILKWKDKSSNEAFFSVDVVDVSDNAATITTAIKGADAATSLSNWTTATTGLTEGSTVTYGKDFYGNSGKGWVAGSLQKNNSYIAIKLSLGVPYLIRIAAVNDAGKSAYAYATYDLDETWQDNDTYHKDSYIAKPFAIKNLNQTTATPPVFEATTKDDIYKADATPTCCVTANLYRLTYHLNQGTLTIASGVTETADLVYYLSEEPTGGINILAPFNKIAATPADQVYPALISSGNRWTSWREKIIEGAMYTTSTATVIAAESFTYYAPSAYKGYKNLDLFASYTVSSASVEAYIDGLYNFVDGEVIIDGAVAAATASSNIIGNGKSYVVYTSSAVSGISAVDDITLKYTFKADPDGTPDNGDERTAFTYSSLFATITRNGKTYAKSDFDAGACTFTVKNLPADGAKYQVTVIGEYKGHQYSYPITITLQDAVALP